MTFETKDPREIAAKGSDIYRRKFQSEFERLNRGRYVAIDIDSEEAYVADFSDQALAKARKAAPTGVFYLVRIGSPGAFKLGRVSHVDSRVL